MRQKRDWKEEGWERGEVTTKVRQVTTKLSFAMS